MSSKRSLEHAREEVDSLLASYNAYLTANRLVTELELRQLRLAAQLARQHGIGLSDVLRVAREFPQLQQVVADRARAEEERQRIADAMTFADPLVWMMYKYYAYKGTASEIRTMAAFRAHCQPEGYICTKRFKFLNSYLRERFGTDLMDIGIFPEGMDLAGILESTLLSAALDDPAFMERWRGHEYYREHGRVRKWENLPEPA